MSRQAFWNGRDDLGALIYTAAYHGNVRRLQDLVGRCTQRDLVWRHPNGGATAIYVACEFGHYSAVEILLEAGAPVDQPRDDGAAPLNTACMLGSVELTELLLRYGAAVDQVDSSGMTPLWVASHQGDVKLAAALLGAGADPDHIVQQWSPLLIGCATGRLEIVKLLCSYSASRGTPTAIGDSTWTPELLAHSRGHLGVMSYLLLSRDWTTPLHYLECLSPHRTRLLLRAGANVRARSVTPATIHPALQAYAPPNLGPNGSPPSPLDLAELELSHDGGMGQGHGGAHSHLPQTDVLLPARMVTLASGPWSPTAHDLFPRSARRRAIELLRVGYLLAYGKYAGESRSLTDAWVTCVLPAACDRSSVELAPVDDENRQQAQKREARRQAEAKRKELKALRQALTDGTYVAEPSTPITRSASARVGEAGASSSPPAAAAASGGGQPGSGGGGASSSGVLRSKRRRRDASEWRMRI